MAKYDGGFLPDYKLDPPDLFDEDYEDDEDEDFSEDDELLDEDEPDFIPGDDDGE